MLIFYVDEVGDGSLSATSIKAHPWFILGAVGIHDVNRRSIAKSLFDVKAQIFGTSWKTKPWKDTEIKGRYLAHAEKMLVQDKSPLKPAGYARLTKISFDSLMDSLFKIYRTFRPVMYAIGIDKQRHINQVRGSAPYDPIAIAYAFLQQRLAALVEHTSNSEECALILADEQKHHENLFRNGQVQAVRSRFQAGMNKAPDIDAIISKPVWIDSDEMKIDREVTQLVDLMLYAVSYGMVHGNWIHNWLEKLGPHFARHWGRGRDIGAVWNAGITIYPSPYYRKIRWAQI